MFGESVPASWTVLAGVNLTTNAVSKLINVCVIAEEYDDEQQRIIEFLLFIILNFNPVHIISFLLLRRYRLSKHVTSTQA